MTNPDSETSTPPRPHVYPIGTRKTHHSVGEVGRKVFGSLTWREEIGRVFSQLTRLMNWDVDFGGDGEGD